MLLFLIKAASPQPTGANTLSHQKSPFQSKVSLQTQGAQHCLCMGLLFLKEEFYQLQMGDPKGYQWHPQDPSARCFRDLQSHWPKCRQLCLVEEIFRADLSGSSAQVGTLSLHWPQEMLIFGMYSKKRYKCKISQNCSIKVLPSASLCWFSLGCICRLLLNLQIVF